MQNGNAPYSATYKKLRSGVWGAKVRGLVRDSQAITVVTRAGDAFTEIVAKVLWTGLDNETGETISLCALKPRATQSVPFVSEEAPF